MQLMEGRYCIGTVHKVVPPPNTADLGTDDKAAVFGNRVVFGGRTVASQSAYKCYCVH